MQQSQYVIFKLRLPQIQTGRDRRSRPDLAGQKFRIGGPIQERLLTERRTVPVATGHTVVEASPELIAAVDTIHDAMVAD
jgi:hypothetical protein